MSSRLTETAKALQHLYHLALKGLSPDIAEPEGPFFNENEQEWYDLLRSVQELGGITLPIPAVPTITGFLPLSGARGTTVVLTGTNFTGATVVSINSGAVASFTVNSPTQITAVLSNTQATGKVRVTVPGAGTAVSAADFTVTSQPATTYTLILWGDSRYGTTGGTPTVPSLLASNFSGNSRVSVQTVQHDGAGLGQPAFVGAGLLSTIGTEIYPLIDAALAAGRVPVVFIEGGINDLAKDATNNVPQATSVANLKAAYANAHSLCQARGAQTVAVTPFAGRGNATPEVLAAYEAARLEVVAHLRNAFATTYNARLLSDDASDKALNEQRDCLNTAVYSDETHLTPAGKVIQGAVPIAATNGLLTGATGVAYTGRPETTDLTAPTAPGTPTVSNLAATSLTLTWAASTDNVGVAGYRVYNSANALLATVSATTANITGLAPSTAYTFYVKAFDAAGNVSNASGNVAATTAAGSAGPPAGFAGIVAPFSLDLESGRLEINTLPSPATWLTFSTSQSAAPTGRIYFSSPGDGGTAVSASYTSNANGQFYGDIIEIWSIAADNGVITFEVLIDGVVRATGTMYNPGGISNGALLATAVAPDGIGVHTWEVRTKAADYTFANSNLFADLVKFKLSTSI